jgi:hypothetical protein
VIFQQIIITHFKNPKRTIDSKLAQEPREIDLDENCPIRMRIEQLESVRRPNIGRRSDKGLKRELNYFWFT